MISSVTSSSIPDPGLAALRPTAEELGKKREATPAVAATPTVNGGEGNSSVVQLSSEAVRLASQSSVKPESALASAAPSAAEPASAKANSATSASTSAPSSPSAVKKYADADANQDGRVSVLEARAYDFAHPTIPKPQQDGDLPPARAANADVKAYEAVARSGRSL
jgi:hypothetical protein